MTALGTWELLDHDVVTSGGTILLFEQLLGPEAAVVVSTLVLAGCPDLDTLPGRMAAGGTLRVHFPATDSHVEIPPGTKCLFHEKEAAADSRLRLVWLRPRARSFPPPSRV